MSEATPQQKPTGRRHFTLGCLAFFLVMLIGCGGLLAWHSQQGWTMTKLERLIKAEARPDWDRAAAKGWFDRHGIWHNWFEDTTGDREGNQTVAQLAGLRDEDLAGMLRGDICTEANVDLIFPGTISIYFFFDRQGRLAGHFIDPFVAMP